MEHSLNRRAFVTVRGKGEAEIVIACYCARCKVKLKYPGEACNVHPNREALGPCREQAFVLVCGV